MNVANRDMGFGQRSDAVNWIVVRQRVVELRLRHFIRTARLPDARVAGQVAYQIDPGYARNGGRMLGSPVALQVSLRPRDHPLPMLRRDVPD